MKNFLKFRRKTGGFLAEVMVSLAILSMGIMSSMVLINDAIRSNAVNKNKIIAINLARESVEAVRVLRETNWIKYGNNKRICWNFWSNTNEDAFIQPKPSGADDLCVENLYASGQNQHPIGCIGVIYGGSESICDDTSTRIKSFLLVQDADNYDWALVENFLVKNPDDFIAEKETWKDSLIATTSDSLTTSDSEVEWEGRQAAVGGLTSRLYLDATTKLYTHNPIGNESTDFYREVFISYPASENGFFPFNHPELDNQIMIKSIVWYRGFGGIMRKVEIETELTDYLERTEWYE